MRLLGIETATPFLSVALLTDGGAHVRTLESRSSHCERLVGFIDELLEEAAVSVREIDGIAVSTGPGSFTGLRIGIATAMGLAYGLSCNTAGIGTLDALAWKARGLGGTVCPLIDARRSEVYTALYRVAGDYPEAVLVPHASPLDMLAEKLNKTAKQVVITGPAAPLYGRELGDRLRIPFTLADTETATPSAISVAERGIHAFTGNGAVEPHLLSPLYIRRSDAEIMRDGKC